jgi:transcription-repair coupling factor (superfamily II helicase)
MVQELLIAARISEFADKSPAWFRHNRHNIEHGAHFNPFWERNLFVVTKNWNGGLRKLVERILALGYQLNSWPEYKGEFALRGGAILIFPVNEKSIWRIEFFGNSIETIEPVSSKTEEIQKNKRRQQSIFEYLRDGDYVVHQDHGIGLWRGMTRENNHEYYLIEYSGPRGGDADTLLVPVSESKRITPYLGFRAPRISRLGTPIWKQTVKRTRDDAVAFAKQLLSIHATRAIAARAPYHAFPELEEKIVSSFPYDETPAQKHALADIMRDFARVTPMDRIVLGDVGFGKTEIALRASVRAAGAGKQVAILAPTTLLCDQHFELWKKRLAGLPLRVVRLSRLETHSEQVKIIKALRTGSIDIIVGTHRLLSADVSFKNLGLLIIDEEQRFGVRAKEHLKEMRNALDVLTLSATPLPRTLSLALSHLKNMSVLDEGPVGRRAPNSFVVPFDKKIITHALRHELDRGGQIYYLENRIRKFPETLKFIESLVPARRVGSIHGRMTEHELIETMEKFRAGKIEILVSTTIIENGLDLAGANTLVVSDATRYGLAQLHQLRGRVGRREEESFAYFLYNPERLDTKAADRLDVIANTQFLGAGSVIAEKDLELRGAGNILGREQSGAANHVGLNLYSQFLSEAVEQLQRK